MAINYKLYQDNRATSSTNSKWFARALHANEVNLKTLAAEIQENVSVKESDVYGVLIELVNVMKKNLLNSNTVRIERLGTFKVGMKTTAADSAAEFNPLTNVQGYRVNFVPSCHMATTGSKRYRVYDILDGATCKETPKNDVKKD